MAPITKRINLATFAGPDPTIDISAEQFAHLEGIYGVALTDADREEVMARANAYLFWRRFELTSANYSEVRTLFEGVKDAVRPFLLFVGGRKFDNSDASALLRGILGLQYKRSPIRVHQSNLSAVQRDGSRKSAQLRRNIVVELNGATLAAFAGSLKYALQKVEQVIRQYEEDDQKGFAPGVAFRNWLISMRQWAKERHYPIAAFKNARKSGTFNEADRSASPFATFLFELNQLFGSAKLPGLISPEKLPVTFEEPVNSPEAMAERLKKVVTTANQLKRGG